MEAALWIYALVDIASIAITMIVKVIVKRGWVDVGVGVWMFVNVMNIMPMGFAG